ncbi:centromere protein O, partial [Tanacetum coccineum]
SNRAPVEDSSNQMGEMDYMQEDDIHLDTTKARFADVLKRHGKLTERLSSKSFLEKMIVLEHTIPFFFPIRDLENEHLSSNAVRFIDHIGDLLQAYVDRRTVHSYIWANLLSILPTAVSVVAWPMNRSKRSPTEGRTGKVAFGSNSAPIRLNYAESAMRTLSLPEGYLFYPQSFGQSKF